MKTDVILMYIFSFLCLPK